MFYQKANTPPLKLLIVKGLIKHLFDPIKDYISPLKSEDE